MNNILLTGAPDAVLVCHDGSLIIADYKTAKQNGDKLLPMYETQLNAYAFLANRLGYAPVSALALIYMEPITEDNYINDDVHRDDGFIMGFRAKIHPVQLDLNRIPPMLAKVREIYKSATIPAMAAACKNCVLVRDLVKKAA